jgi:phosphatidylserine/phosphatidylglycerophosphate/cardiolipin synthase-like enzyme
MLWTYELGKPPGPIPNTTQADGSFSIGPYEGPSSFDFSGSVSISRKVALEIHTSCHRLLYRKEFKEFEDQDTLDFGIILLAASELQGFVVTLGDATKPAGLGGPMPMRPGNAIQPLVDNQAAWGRAADAIVNVNASIDVMQLEFDVPSEFDPAPPQEAPEIVLSFDRPLDAQHPRPVLDAMDYRPERLLIDKASQDKIVRVILPTVSINWAIAGVDFVLLLAPLLLAFITDVGNMWARIFGAGGHGAFSNVREYFNKAASAAHIGSFDVTMFNRVHSKLVLVDATPTTAKQARLIMVSSPFSQSYFDSTTNGHHVFDPRRGSATGEPVPVHDVSLAVRGPILQDVYDTYRLHWNRDAAAADKIADTPVVPPAVTDPDPANEYMASLQLVRTINDGAFNEIPGGEQGILEAYLRGIEMAKDLIYIENQYFTNRTIADALVAALNDRSRPGLQIIMLFNVSPDLPFYPMWQSDLVERIRENAGPNAKRIEFFTAWSHDPPLPQDPFRQTKPMVMANYVHSKFAVVDDLWATVGSANLDGASLDAFQFLHAFQFGDNRNHELNFIVQDDTPKGGAVDALRRSLWSEHLGFDNVKEGAIDYSQKDKFLELWKNKAAGKLATLTGSPASINPGDGRVLRWPDKAKIGVWRTLLWPRWPFESSERYVLDSAGVKFDKLDLIEQVRAFNFQNGKFT